MAQEDYDNFTLNQLRDECLKNKISLPLFATREIMIQQLEKLHACKSSDRRPSRSPSPLPTPPFTPYSKSTQKKRIYETPKNKNYSQATPIFHFDQIKSFQTPSSKDSSSSKIYIIFFVMVFVFLIITIYSFIFIYS